MRSPLLDIACDESGNTGENLMDPAQPVYALASVLLNRDTAKAVIRDSFPKALSEAKFSKLRKNKTGQEAVLHLLDVSELRQSTRIWIVHKPFMAMAKVVDVLIESAMHKDGHNLYGSGEHVALANLWHFTMPPILGDQTYRQFLNSFLNMMRKRDESAIESFFALVEEVVNQEETNELSETLSTLLYTETTARQLLIEPPVLLRDEVDPAVTSLFALCTNWTKSLGEPFRLIHDEAAVVERWLPYLKEFSGLDDEDPTVIGHGEFQIVLPLLIKEIQFADSKLSHQVQIADVLAGAARLWAHGAISKKMQSPWWEKVASRITDHLDGGTVPTGEFVPDPEAHGVDYASKAADFLAERRSR